MAKIITFQISVEVPEDEFSFSAMQKKMSQIEGLLSEYDLYDSDWFDEGDA